MKNHQEILEHIADSFSDTIEERFCRRKLFIRFFESKCTIKKRRTKFSYDQVGDHFEFEGITTDMIYDYYSKKYNFFVRNIMRMSNLFHNTIIFPFFDFFFFLFSINLKSFVKQLICLISGDNLVFYFSTTSWLRFQQEARRGNINLNLHLI